MNLIDKEKRFIIIDIGSNSIKSTFYNINLITKEIIKYPFYRRLFKLLNHFRNGLLPSHSIDKIIEDFQQLSLRVKNNTKYKNSKIYCFATEVFRRAYNYTYIQMLIYRNTGIYIDVLGGLREGYILYLAFLYFYLPNHHKSKENSYYGLIDYGGGSCEIVICNKNKIIEIKSLKIGSLVLLIQNILNNTNLFDWSNIVYDINKSLNKIVNSKNFEAIKFYSASASLKSINFLMTKVFYKQLKELYPDASIVENNLKSMILLQNLILPMNNRALQRQHRLKIGYNSIRCALLTFTAFYHKFKVEEINAITCSVRDGYLAMLLLSFIEMRDILNKSNLKNWKFKNARITRSRSS